MAATTARKTVVWSLVAASVLARGVTALTACDAAALFKMGQDEFQVAYGQALPVQVSGSNFTLGNLELFCTIKPRGAVNNSATVVAEPAKMVVVDQRMDVAAVLGGLKALCGAWPNCARWFDSLKNDDKYDLPVLESSAVPDNVEWDWMSGWKERRLDGAAGARHARQ